MKFSDSYNRNNLFFLLISSFNIINSDTAKLDEEFFNHCGEGQNVLIQVARKIILSKISLSVSGISAQESRVRDPRSGTSRTAR